MEFSKEHNDWLEKRRNEELMKICGEDTLSFPDIRNKLTPLKNLIAMIENGLVKGSVEIHDLVLDEVKASKESIAYLSGNKSLNEK